MTQATSHHSTPPIISVILAVGNQRERAVKALASILAQDGIEQAEVLLLDCSTDPNASPLPGSDNPRVCLIRKLTRDYYGKMRADAVAVARGKFVAFLEEHCIAQPGWLKNTVRALEGGWMGAGGEGGTLNSGDGISDLMGLLNYPNWRPPAKYGPSRMMPGQNSAYHREALLAFGSDLAPLMHNEILLQWKLQDKGHVIGIDPAIKYLHLHETHWRSSSQGLFWYCRSFGHFNAQFYGWSWPKRLLRAVTTAGIPLARFTRYVRGALTNRPDDLKLIVFNFPLIWFIDSVSATGMALGYLFGPGDTLTQFTDYELDEERQS